MRAVEEERNSGSSLDVLRCRGTSQPNPDEESSADDRDRRVHCVSLRVGVISVGPYCLAFVSRAIPNGRIRSSYGPCLALPWEGAGSPEMGDPAWEGGGHVRDGDVAGHFDPGERLHSPRPVGKAWLDRSEAPLARSTALGAVSIGLQRQTIWHASIVRPSAPKGIGRTAEICTEIRLAFCEVGASTFSMARRRHSGGHRPHGNHPERLTSLLSFQHEPTHVWGNLTVKCILPLLSVTFMMRSSSAAQ